MTRRPCRLLAIPVCETAGWLSPKARAPGYPRFYSGFESSYAGIKVKSKKYTDET